LTTAHPSPSLAADGGGDGDGLLWEITDKGDIRVSGPSATSASRAALAQGARGDQQAFHTLEVRFVYRTGFP